MYKALFHPKIKSDLKKIPKNVLSKVKTLIETELLKNPESGEILKGKFSEIYSYHFKVQQVEYKIAYSIFSEKSEVYIYMISKRENFYKRLDDRAN